ncbi:hypothetical protein DRP05_04485 [Archaeoglobales archaeon]|nr:MAG: hypothetical protein DRP05_04485 [Archaeoglobales archaeon]
MEALKASMFVGVSAFFRILFAQQLSNSFDLKLCLAFCFTALAIYILDRSFDYESNEFVFAILFVLLSFVLFSSFMPFIALFIGFLYSKGVKGFRLKRGYGVKNLVTALTWGVNIAFYSKINTLIIVFFTVKSFIITLLNDFKDTGSNIK